LRSGRTASWAREQVFHAKLKSPRYVAYDDSSDLQAMIEANLIAERTVIESYGQIIKRIGDEDPATRRLVQDILSDEEEHAEELKEWLAD
jgi:bacterioferritin